MKRNNRTLIKLLNQHLPAGVQKNRKEKLKKKITSILAEILVRALSITKQAELILWWFNQSFIINKRMHTSSISRIQHP